MYSHDDFVVRIHQLRDLGMGYHAIAREVWGMQTSAYAYNVAVGKVKHSALCQECYALLVDWMATNICPHCGSRISVH